MSLKLIINNDLSQLETDNEELLKFLHTNLRFRQKGYHFHPLYRAKSGMDL